MAVLQETVCSTGFDGTVCLWDGSTGDALTVISPGLGKISSLLAISEDFLVMGTASGVIVVWDVRSEVAIATLKGHANGVWSLAILDDGCSLASGGFDGTVRVQPLPDSAVVPMNDVIGLGTCKGAMN